MFRKFTDDETGRLDQALRIEAQPSLFCSACLSLITDEKSAIEIDGTHRHTCTNPAGLTFTIGCFDEAPGCTQAGAPTGEFTWFPGYRWSIALCIRCRKHLGWVFLGSADRFYGLILSELIEK